MINHIKRILMIILLTGLSACSDSTNETSKNALQGEWELLSEKMSIGENSFPTFDPVTGRMMKMFTNSHFSFTSIGDIRPRFTSYQLTNEEKIIAFDNFGGGAGRYSYENGYLTEHIEFSKFPNYEGVSIKFKITIKDDQMIQEGYYPLKTLGLGAKDGYLYSVFKRIE